MYMLPFLLCAYTDIGRWLKFQIRSYLLHGPGGTQIRNLGNHQPMLQIAVLFHNLKVRRRGDHLPNVAALSNLFDRQQKETLCCKFNASKQTLAGTQQATCYYFQPATAPSLEAGGRLNIVTDWLTGSAKAKDS